MEEVICMELVPWRPFGELSPFRQEMDNLWNRFFKNGKKVMYQTDVALAIKNQEGDCRDRFYRAIEKAETNIIAEFKKTNGGNDGRD